MTQHAKCNYFCTLDGLVARALVEILGAEDRPLMEQLDPMVTLRRLERLADHYVSNFKWGEVNGQHRSLMPPPPGVD